jgi:hypothetical protein
MLGAILLKQRNLKFSGEKKIKDTCFAKLLGF